MRQTLILFLLVYYLIPNASSQEKAPELLREATHCLVTEKQGWLAMPKGKSTMFSMAYFVDRKSYPHEEVLYIVSYQTRDHSTGYVFTVFPTQKGSRRIFNVQNNAKFVISSKGIDFVEAPLGGIWTQEHLEAGIRQAERRPTYTFRASDLLVSTPLIGCESYADNIQGQAIM
jgi:hypothetical protein